MMQNIIVYIIVTLAVVYGVVTLVRAIARADKGESSCGGGSCEGCSCRSKDDKSGGCGGC